MKIILKQGQTSQRIVVFIQDSSVTTGAGLTGLTFSSSGLVWYYWREDSGNAGGTSVTLATATRGTWSTGGFIEIDSANLPGFYELGVPNAVLSASNTPKWAVMMLKGAANMVQTAVEVQLVPWDPTDAVRLGLSALPNSAAASAGGLPTVGTGASQLDVDASGRVNIGKILGGVVPAPNVTGIPKVDVSDWLGVAPNVLISGRVDASTGAVGDKTGYSLSALESPIVESGTAQAGASSTITLRSGASATDNLFRSLEIKIYGGTGAGQARTITGYVGSTKVATVDNPWITNPDVTSTYAISAHPLAKLDGSQQVTAAAVASVSGSVGSVAGAVGSVTAPVTVASQQIQIKKNVALTLPFFMFDSTLHQLVTGKTVTVKYSIDGGAQSSTSNGVAEVGGGEYRIALLAAEMNGTIIALTMTASGCDDQAVTIFTQA
jgi:hypothetical protein